jgi:hypothetical protein
MSLQLLLAWADDHRPVLPEGLSLETLQSAPRPGSFAVPDRLWDVGDDPNLLARQRWGLVVPSGPEGDRLLKLIHPLRQARQAEQGDAPVRIYEVSPGMDERAAVLWKKRTFLHEAVPGLDRPRYLLILGDLHQVSLELQQVLAMDAFVGRLAFPSDEGYEAYVSKVLRWERASARESKPRLLVYTSRDGSDATEQGHRMLISPGLESCRKLQREGRLPVSEILELEDLEGAPGERLLTHAAEPVPSVLFTLSHGLGLPSIPPERQRELQGALVLPGEQHLKTEDVASRSFLPGGIWFCFACFSAGTPARSTYLPWLQQLRGTNPSMERVFASLPHEDQRPFVAAQPQAALANPEGPLAVMGHVDLAWSYGFNDQGTGTPSRFFEVLRLLTEGRRAGVALHHLLLFASAAGNELALLYKQEEVARAAGRPSPIHQLERASAWMRRQDLAGYVLLGDPAVRLAQVAR